MERAPKIYGFSKWGIMLGAGIIFFYTTAIIIIIAASYYRSVILGIVVTVPFLLCLLDPLTRFLRVLYYSLINRPALLLLDDKLVDNVNNVIIYWEEIGHIGWLNKSKLGGQITITPNDLSLILKRIKNPYRKIILRLNQRYFNGAISISPNLIKCKKNELYYELVNTHFKNR